MSQKQRCRIVYKDGVIDPEIATYLFTCLKNNIEWGEGIRSRRGFTRKAKMVGYQDKLYFELLPYVMLALEQLTTQRYNILGMYLNYYENGEMYTPSHSHKDSHQLVISLGATRTLKVSQKEFNMTNGSSIIFGSSVHTVPKSDTKEERISIATFMVPINAYEAYKNSQIEKKI